MRVHIRYGDSFSDLSKPLHAYSHTEAVALIERAIRTGHAKSKIYVIEEAPTREDGRGGKMSEETKQLLANRQHQIRRRRESSE